jgi:septal ring factor EnvC (AmiA/AmiB activator)
LHVTDRSSGQVRSRSNSSDSAERKSFTSDAGSLSGMIVEASSDVSLSSISSESAESTGSANTMVVEEERDDLAGRLANTQHEINEIKNQLAILPVRLKQLEAQLKLQKEQVAELDANLAHREGRTVGKTDSCVIS